MKYYNIQNYIRYKKDLERTLKELKIKIGMNILEMN